MKKKVFFDKRAEREIKKFPKGVRRMTKAMVIVLGRDGKLAEPLGKKLDSNLFEIRIKYRGQWRVLYAYWIRNQIVILSAFRKKSQKTPKKEIKKAKDRLKFYLYEK